MTFVSIFLVVCIIVFTTVSNAQYEEPGQKNITGNDTDEVSMGAIGRYAPTRQSYGFDQNGKIRHKW